MVLQSRAAEHTMLGQLSHTLQRDGDSLKTRPLIERVCAPPQIKVDGSGTPGIERFSNHSIRCPLVGWSPCLLAMAGD